jgi:uncharacterized membrane protein
MPSNFFGLPLHPLIVHATVVMVPLAVLAVLGAVLVPPFRRWAGLLPSALALVAMILTPMSTASGEELEERVGDTAAIERHAELGEQLIWFTVALFVVAVAFWWVGRRPADGGETTSLTRRPAIRALVGAAAVLVALGSAVQVARIGHSGAEATWSGNASSTP